MDQLDLLLLDFLLVPFHLAILWGLQFQGNMAQLDQFHLAIPWDLQLL